MTDKIDLSKPTGVVTGTITMSAPAFQQIPKANTYTRLYTERESLSERGTKVHATINDTLIHLMRTLMDSGVDSHDLETMMVATVTNEIASLRMTRQMRRRNEEREAERLQLETDILQYGDRAYELWCEHQHNAVKRENRPAFWDQLHPQHKAAWVIRAKREAEQTGYEEAHDE